MKTITHLEETTIGGPVLHISHLYNYVSAWANTTEEVQDLGLMLKYAMAEAKATTKTQIVDKDGECCFHVTPAGYIILMLPWKTYKVHEEAEIIITMGTDVPPPPEEKPYQPFTALFQVYMVDSIVDVYPIDSEKHGIMMCIGTDKGPIYITKDQAKTFFNLEDKQ